MRILLVNPNTSEAMAEVMGAEARRIAALGTEVEVLSASFGSAYISTRAEAAVAGHALLTALAQGFDGHDAVVVGAFIMPALTEAAKEVMPVPVVSTGEAGLALASVLGKWISVLSIGDPGRKMTQEIVAASGLTGRLASIRDMGLGGTELTERQGDADGRAIALAREAVEVDLADVVVLGAGSMEGMARRIQPEVPVPVVSPVGAAVGMAETLVRLGVAKPSRGVYAVPRTGPMMGIDPALAKLLSGGG